VDDNHGNAAGASITATTGTNWADPVHDATGNMTTAPKPSSPASGLTLKYDAWNRLVEVEVSGTGVFGHEYDGLSRRIINLYDFGESEWREYFYYNASWQILERRWVEAQSAQPETLQPYCQYVWSARYIDSPVEWDVNADQDGLCDDQRIYVLSDANFNVTCLTDTGGDPLEHFRRTPRRDQCAAAIGTAVERVRNELVDGLGGKLGPRVLLMPRLPATFPLFSALGQRLLGLNDVARRRLGGSRGVFACRGQLPLQTPVLLAQTLVFLTQPAVLLTQPSVFGFQTGNAPQGVGQLLFQSGKALCQRLAVRAVCRRRQLHGAERFPCHATRTRSTRCLRDRILGNFLGGRLTAQKNALRINFRSATALGSRWPRQG